MRARISAQRAAAAIFCLLLSGAAVAPAQPPAAPAGAPLPVRMTPLPAIHAELTGRN